jgi:L-idonate 5-dehydrogenase
MRAVVAHGAKDLRIDDVPSPVPGDDGVVVRVAFGGICGSDLHYHQDGRNGIYDLQEPLILGHEIVGTVAEVGPAADRPLSIGTRVAIHPARPTPLPGAHQARGLHLAIDGSYLGSASTSPHTQGGFAEFIRVRPEQLRPLPDTLPLRRATLAEPLAVAVHGIDRVAGGVAGSRVLVSGAGPIGCLAAAVLRLRGASEIVATDLHPFPLAIASAVGASSTVLLGDDPAPGPESFDVVIEASGSPRAFEAALTAVRRGGTVVQLGMLPSGPLEVPLAVLVSHEVTLHGSQRFEIELDDLQDPEVDDLLDDLGEHVLRTGGDVVVVPAARMPTGTGVAATFRY